MADTAITSITWDHNDGTDVAAGQGTAIVHANTHVITPTGPLEDLVIMVTNTEGSTNAVTVLAGDNPPAQSAGLGNKTFTTIGATTGRIILPPLESARFLQSDGTVRITVEAGMTGYIMALQKPVVSACT
jgi:hypothetical protein